MEEIKLSVVCTIFNEATTIIELLGSLKQQTHTPSEIILIDAGSTDGTKKLIERYQTDNLKLSIKFIEKVGTNRSKARNIGITIARNEHIAVIDAGCRADKDWLKYLAYSFKLGKEIQTVAGYYEVNPNTFWQEGFAPYLAVMPDRFDMASFLPSSRSMAFTKTAWQKAGKYPENLDTCEDLFFARKIANCSKMVVEPKAIVSWRLPNSLEEFFVTIVKYSRGDVEATYQPHLIKISSVLLRYVVFGLVPYLFAAYLVFPILRHGKYIKKPENMWVLSLIQVTSDLAVISGLFWGLARRIRLIAKSCWH
jgi:glycosyltransferase involved in cell wall biosynthesis